jgi:Mn2+/Fe2+ NRAMP family transporter
MGNKKAEKKLGLLQRFVAVLGLGLITGAADDDPSAVATYSIVSARLGVFVD